MILGQSAATAAVIAIDRNIDVQAVSYSELAPHAGTRRADSAQQVSLKNFTRLCRTHSKEPHTERSCRKQKDHDLRRSTLTVRSTAPWSDWSDEHSWIPQ